jgi:bifunctional DNase/RNase
MKKVELKIIGLSYSQTQAGSYVLVLGERKGKGKLKLPIIIKPNDAQFIAMKMEGLKTPRPLTHELFKKITDNFSVDLQQIFISNVLEGIFYAKLIFSNIVDEFEIDCSVGDAICLALSYKCPVFCSKEVLNISGIEMDEDGTVSETQNETNHKERDYSGGVTVENLEKMLEKAIQNEEYEIASQLRDRINELKNA